MPAPSAKMPDLPDQTVVATFDDGVKLTMADFRKLYAALPPQLQQGALQDRSAFLKQWAFLRKLAKMAEQDKLDQESPTKESLEYYRLQIMSTAELNQANNLIVIDQADLVKHYDVNKEKYKTIKVKAIYISFSSDGKKGLTEAQAKAKAAKILAQVRSGGDFVKLVKENSEDETSRAKNGDFAMLRPTDNIPDAIRSAVFALKQGETTEPVRQPSGFYLLRADEVAYRPFSQVRDDIFNELKQQRYAQWLEKTNREMIVTFNPEFLGFPK
jgi:parvulin-like peptidyl-prolyl isomerase